METLEKQTTQTWNIDPVHSTVNFQVAYMGLSKFGAAFKDIEGKLVYTDNVYHLTGSVPVTTVHVKEQALYGHLMSSEFFDAENYPELTFESTDLKIEDGVVTGTGKLTIKGNTHEVAFSGTLNGPIEDAYGNQRLGLNLSTEVDRTQFGLNWNMPLPSGQMALSNTVEISVEIQAVQS